MGKNIGKIINKSLRGKCSQKLLDHGKQFATDAFKITSKRVIQKTAEGIGDLIGNKITNKILKILRNSPQNTSNTLTYIYIYIQKNSIKIWGWHNKIIMEYQKIINLLDKHQINYLNLRQKIGSKWMMNHEKRIT